MNISKKLIAAAVAVLPLATFAQTDINFEESSKYSAVGVYDWWEDSPFRTDPSLGNCAVVTNPDAADPESANTSAKVLGFQRSIHGSNMYGARIDLPAGQRFVLTPQVKYVHVLMKKPADARSGRSMVIGLGKHNSATTGYATTWASQPEDVVQFTALGNNKATAGQWTDVVFPVKGAGNIDIYSLVIVPDCEDPSDLTEDFIVYLDDVKVNTSNAPTVALVGDYPTVFEKDQAYSKNDRHLDRLTVTTALGEFTKQAGAKMYTEAFDSFIPVKAGETVSVQMSYTGNWMHSFYYLDKNRNGKFEVLDTEATELVTASYGDDQAHSSAYGQKQTFTIPADLVPGVYRLRGKVDWLSTDPAGNDGSAGNFIVDNRGAIIDVLLNVYNADAVSVNTVQRNGTMVLANGDDIDNFQQPAATALKVKAKPEQGFDYAGMLIHIGYPGEPEHGNPQSYTVEVPWQDFDKDDCYTIPAAYLTAPVQVEGDMREAGTVNKDTTGGDVTVYEGLKVSPAPSATAFDKSTVWYTLANQQTDQTVYLSIARTNGNFLATNITAKDETDAGLWCIVGDATNGFKFYNKAAGPTKVLSNNASTASGMVAASATTNVTFILSERATKGVWSIKDFDSANNYWCGSDNKLAHWDHANAANDNNCRFVFEEVEAFEIPVDLAALIAEAQGYYDVHHNDSHGDGLITRPDQFDSNASDAQEGTSFGPLLDGDAATFWHSNWHDVSGNTMDQHYLQVELDEPISGIVRCVNVRRSNAQADFVTRCHIEGSADGASYSRVADVVFPYTSIDASKGETVSGDFALDAPCRYLRFYITETKGQASNRVYGHFAEFQLYAVSATDAAVTHPAEAAALLAALSAARDVDAPTDDDFQALQAAFDAYREAVESSAGMMDDYNAFRSLGAELQQLLAEYSAATASYASGKVLADLLDEYARYGTDERPLATAADYREAYGAIRQGIDNFYGSLTIGVLAKFAADGNLEKVDDTRSRILRLSSDH